MRENTGNAVNIASFGRVSCPDGSFNYGRCWAGYADSRSRR